MQECKGVCGHIKYKVQSEAARSRGESPYNLLKNRVYCTTCRAFLVITRENAWHGNKCPCCHTHFRVSPRHRKNKRMGHKEWYDNKAIV